jgi:CheW-like domain
VTGAVSEPAARATVFTVGGVEYGVTGRVVRSLPAARPLPAELVHGGRSFPVVDLPGAFDVRPEVVGEELIFLVEQGDVRRALVVGEVVGREAFDPDAVQPVPALYPEPERARWGGLVLRPDGRLVVLLRLEGLPTTADGRTGGEG